MRSSTDQLLIIRGLYLVFHIPEPLVHGSASSFLTLLVEVLQALLLSLRFTTSQNLISR